MEPKDSLPHSQEPDTCPYLSYINPIHAYLSYFFKTNFNIILSATSRSTQWSLFLRFSHQKPSINFSSPVTYPAYIIRLASINRLTFGEEYRS